MTSLAVYSAIAAISAAFSKSGIAKRRQNESDRYSFRGIDDVYNHLAPLLAAHQLCILPRILDREASERRGPDGELLTAVTVKVAFDLVSAVDGSRHTVEMFGEAVDMLDKATNKAMSAAYKYAAFQTFCIPTQTDDEAENSAQSSNQFSPAPEPIVGWPQWCDDFGESVKGCQTEAAVDRLCSSERSLLASLARAAPEAYAEVGRTVKARRNELLAPIESKCSPSAGIKRSRKGRAANATC